MNPPCFSCPRCRTHLDGAHQLSCGQCGYGLRMDQGIWRDDVLPQPDGFSQQQRQHLSAIEKRHFWFGPRDQLLGLLARRELSSGATALELGGGSGRLLKTWDGLFDSVTMVESHVRSLEDASSRGSQASLIQADVCRLPLEDEQFTALMAFDVLEHVVPDEMLSEARRVARAGAKFLISVPAYQSLWSYADAIAGHRCRYDLNMLAGELHKQSWRLIGFTHYQFALFPLLWFSRRILREHGRIAEREPSRLVDMMLGKINSAEVAICANLSLPFGSSLIVWAEAV